MLNEEVTYVVTIVNRNPKGLDEISSKEKHFLSELEKYCTNILTPIHIGLDLLSTNRRN